MVMKMFRWVFGRFDSSWGEKKSIVRRHEKTFQKGNIGDMHVAISHLPRIQVAMNNRVGLDSTKSERLFCFVFRSKDILQQ